MNTLTLFIASALTIHPVTTRYTADPAGVVDGDNFYIFAGHDEATNRGYRMFDYSVLRSKDGEHWEDLGTVLNLRAVFPWARADMAWASQAIKRGDKWYWYIATQRGDRAQRKGDAIAVAVADRPEGPWKDAIGGPLVEGRGYIDPSVFIDDDGSAWLFWGNCGGNPGCWYAELNADMISLKSEVKPVPGLMDPKAFGEPLVKRLGAGVRKNGEKNTNFEEAPWIYKVGDTYYLEYAAGGVPEHWAYSTAKSIHGPWTYQGRVLDEDKRSETRHGGSVYFKGRWYLITHDGALKNSSGGRRSVAVIPQALTPTVWSDIPDVAPLRVGDTYYMTSTTMHFNPGIPVMESKDLVHWKIISYCYDTIEDAPKYALDGGDDYGFGTWASSIRYHDGWFYVSSFNNQAKHTYIFRSKSPKGPWEKHIIPELVYDHSLWFEGDKAYFFRSKRPGVGLREIAPDFNSVLPGEETVCKNAVDVFGGKGLAEGTQVFKRGEYYYIVNICWPRGSCRSVVVHRSKNFKGPYDEGKVVFQHEGIAQGSFIDRPDGSWVAVLFADRGGVGRCPFIMEVEWQDDWPMVQERKVSNCEFSNCESAEMSVVADDDFEGKELKLEWQWNHNPDNANWALKDGKLAIITSRIDDNLLKVKNQLTQRTIGPECAASIVVDGSKMKVGDRAGIALFQQRWGAIALERTEKGFEVVNLPQARERTAIVGDKVYLKANCDFRPYPFPRYEKIPAHIDQGWFEYSLDGKTWTQLGGKMPMPYTIPHFTGYRFSLFNWATKEAGGIAAFDDYRVKPSIGSAANFHTFAPQPPMGWNSWDSYGPLADENDIKRNADAMAEKLLKFGYEYCVLDIRWYVQNEVGANYNQKDPIYTLDEYGRYLPDPQRFPSSTEGRGLKPLADYVHSKGLKFGIHIMRGVPKEAVSRKLPVKGAPGITCDMIVDDDKTECEWLRDNCTVRLNREGGQAYYDSIIELYASWGVDFIKCDDLSAPTYHEEEVTMLRRAIDRCGRAMVLSTSPGETPLKAAGHLRENANMWRMVNDVWDKWKCITHLLPITADWLKEPAIAGSWADCDMLPFGTLSVKGHGKTRPCRLTADEQRTMMTLWCIARSPLIFGGDVPSLDEATLKLLTNCEVLAVDQTASNARLLEKNGDIWVFTSDAPDGGKFLAVINAGDADNEYSVDLKVFGSNEWHKRDIWEQRDEGVIKDTLTGSLKHRASALYHLFR